MSKKFKRGLLALAFGVAASFVQAEEASKWEGFYAGAHFGGAIGSPEMKLSTVYSASGFYSPTAVAAINATGDQKGSQGSMNYALEGGYNFAFGNIILGAQADFGSMGLNVSSQNSDPPNGIAINQQIQSSWTGMVRPRVGLDMGGVLPFLTSGLAFTSLNYGTFFGGVGSGGGGVGGFNMILTGLVMGGGVEFKINDKVSLDSEYLLTDYGSVAVANIAPAGGGTANVFTDTLSLVTHQIHLSVNLHL